MALPAAPDREQLDDAVTPEGAAAPGGTPAARRSARIRWGVLGVLVLLIVGSLGYLGNRIVADGTGSGWHRVSSAFSGEDPLQSERDAVMSQARQFALRLNTYGPDLLDATTKQMPTYRSQVEKVITAKYRTAFEKDGVPLVEATVSQLGVKRTAQVYATGVAVIDADTATALVAGAFTNSYPTKKGSSDYTAAAPEPFRFEVQLVKTGGTWLVDGFNPASQASTGSTGSGGSAGSTDGAAQ